MWVPFRANYSESSLLAHCYEGHSHSFIPKIYIAPHSQPKKSAWNLPVFRSWIWWSVFEEVYDNVGTVTQQRRMMSQQMTRFPWRLTIGPMSSAASIARPFVVVVVFWFAATYAAQHADDQRSTAWLICCCHSEGSSDDGYVARQDNTRVEYMVSVQLPNAFVKPSALRDCSNISRHTRLAQKRILSLVITELHKRNCL